MVNSEAVERRRMSEIINFLDDSELRGCWKMIVKMVVDEVVCKEADRVATDQPESRLALLI